MHAIAMPAGRRLLFVLAGIFAAVCLFAIRPVGAAPAEQGGQEGWYIWDGGGAYYRTNLNPSHPNYRIPQIGVVGRTGSGQVQWFDGRGIPKGYRAASLSEVGRTGFIYTQPAPPVTRGAAGGRSGTGTVRGSSKGGAFNPWGCSGGWRFGVNCNK